MSANGGAAGPAGPSVRGAIIRFAVAGLVAMAALGVAGGIVLNGLAEDEAADDARRLATLAGRGVVEPSFTDAALAGDPAALEDLDLVVQERVLTEDVVRVKIWAPDGTILYSDEPRLIGRRYPLGADERTALAEGVTEAELSDLSKPENVYEREGGDLLEVYLPIRAPGGGQALFELYQRQSAIDASGRRLLEAVAPVAIGSLLLLWLIQLPLAWSIGPPPARRPARARGAARGGPGVVVGGAPAHRRRPPRRAGPEPRGPVVLPLRGCGARARGHRPGDGTGAGGRGRRRARRASGACAPPWWRSTRAASTTPASPASIADLAGVLRARGVTVDVEVPADLSLAPATEEMFYRAAAEALRNVAAHAEATRVGVRVTADDTRAALRIEDDGRGFDAATRARRREEGHLGLALVEDLAVAPGRDARSSPPSPVAGRRSRSRCRHDRPPRRCHPAAVHPGTRAR